MNMPFNQIYSCCQHNCLRTPRTDYPDGIHVHPRSPYLIYSKNLTTRKSVLDSVEKDGVRQDDALARSQNPFTP